MRTKKTTLAVTLTLALALAACGGDGDGGGGGGGGGAGGGGGGAEPLKIGVIVPQSGNFAPEGEEVKRGYELMLEKAGGEMGGRPVELVFGDALAPEDATAEVERLASQEDVDMFMGSYASTTGQAGSDAAQRLGLTYIETHGTVDALTERGLPNFFRIGARASDFARASAEFIVDGLPDDVGKNVWVEHEEGIYGTAVADFQIEELEKAGYTIVGRGAHSPAATDVTDSILSAKRANPDIWLHTGYAPDSILMVKTSAAQQFNPKALILVGAGDTKAVFDAIGADIITDTFVVAYSSEFIQPEWAPGNEEFYSAYRETYNSEPLGSVANVAYSGMAAVIEMLDAAEGDPSPEAVRAAVEEIDLPFGSLPIGWGLQFDEGGTNTAIRLVTTQWREDGTTPAIFPEEARLEGQEMVLGQ
jgi:branched-chain amino acid transport system substrate-binding protein